MEERKRESKENKRKEEDGCGNDGRLETRGGAGKGQKVREEQKEETRYSQVGMLEGLQGDIPDSCRRAWIILGPLLARDHEKTAFLIGIKSAVRLCRPRRRGKSADVARVSCKDGLPLARPYDDFCDSPPGGGNPLTSRTLGTFAACLSVGCWPLVERDEPILSGKSQEPCLSVSRVLTLADEQAAGKNVQMQKRKNVQMP
jgi:hypothetical protein